MVRIALAGGTGGLGHTILDELCQGSEHTLFVFSRKTQLPFEVPSNVHCLTTNYQSVNDLNHLLRSNNVHTIISTLNPPTPEVQTAQNNLIRAAAQSGIVKRFIPSEWSIDCFGDDEYAIRLTTGYSISPTVRHLPLPWKVVKQQSIAELNKYPNLEYTMVYNGYFMDYFGMPHYQSYMLPEIPYVDIAAAKAAIPGSGNDKVTFTFTKDVARFVRKLVESSDEWPVRTLIAGDVVTFNQIVEAAERSRDMKFDIVHDSLEDMRAGKVTEIPAYQSLYKTFPKEFLIEMMAGFGVAMVTGLFIFHGELFNEKYPEIRTTKMIDFIKTHWSNPDRNS